MALKLPLPMHAGVGHRHISVLLHLAAACYLLLVPLSRASSSSSVVTRLPGFDGPLPFYLETGYVDVDEDTGTELFYYFVESERSPRTDPVLLWFSGGPRCSVFSGLAFEIGPIQFVSPPSNTPQESSLPQLVYNPYSWTQVASILLVDSPVGSGFSYARDPKGYNVGDYSSSVQIVPFLKQWLIDHPQYLSNIFYIGGDSYGGKVVPLITQYISEGIEERQLPRINLKGYLVGNPVTDARFDNNSLIPASHSFGIISDQIYEAAVEHCKGDYLNPPANKLCAEVLLTINNLLSEIQMAHVLYDLCPKAAPKPKYNGDSRRALSEEFIQLNETPVRPLVCFEYRYNMADYWMNDNATRDALGVKKGTIDTWIRCAKRLPYAQDMPSSIKYHLNLTTRGYRALVYSGDHDLRIPFLGTQAWIRSLNFSIVDDWRAWHLDSQAAGFTITYANNLTFATVKGAGHTAPEYKPAESFAMAQRWLNGERL